MPVISITGTVAANTMSSNLLSGQQFEFVPGRSIIRLSVTGSATGLYAYFNVGGVEVANASYVPPTNAYPVEPDDRMVSVGARGGERLTLTLNNTTAGDLTYYAKISIVS